MNSDLAFNQVWPRYRRLPAALALASGAALVAGIGVVMTQVAAVPGIVVWPIVAIYVSIEAGLAVWMVYAGRRFDPAIVDVTSHGVALRSKAGTRLSAPWRAIIRVEGPLSSRFIPEYYVLWFRNTRGKIQTRGLLPEAAKAVKERLVAH